MSDPRREAVATLPALAFVLYAATLPTGIAPMGIGLALCGVATVLLRRPALAGLWPEPPLALPALVWVLAMGAASVFGLDTAASLPRLKHGLMVALVPLAAMHARDRRTGERALAAYLVLSAVAATWGIGVWWAQGGAFPVRARGLSGHYMTFAGQLLLELPVAVAVLLCAGSRRWRVGAAAFAVLAAVALAVTYTRSAWLGVLASGSVILSALAPRALLVLGGVAVLVYLTAPGAFGERLRSMFDPSHPWNRERMHMWEAGLRMFRDHPLTGVGLQDLHALYDRYRAPGSIERAGHLHSTLLQIAASMGIVGLMAFAWLYGTLVRLAASGLRFPLRARGLGAGLRLGVVAALAGFLVAGAFEWNFGDEELLHPLYVLVGMAWASREWGEDE